MQDVNKIIKKIQKECRPYLKNTYKKYNNNFLYCTSNEDVFFKKFNVKPKKLNKQEKIIETLGFDKFGIKMLSESIFCHYHWSQLLQYGKPYFIFPIGDYDTLSSWKIKNIYKELENQNDIEYWFHNDSKYKLNKFTGGLNEVILCCDSYYILDRFDILNKFGVKDIKSKFYDKLLNI